MAQVKTEQKKSEPIRILIADDHPIFRDGLKSLLETEPSFVVVGESSDGDEVFDAVERWRPDILLLDLNMRRMHGIQTLKALKSSDIPVRVIVLTAEIQKTQVIEMVLEGASGMILKDTSTELLFKAIRTVMTGQYWIDHDSVNNLIQTLRDLATSVTNERRKDNFGLTPRELEILCALAGGDTNKDIASRFGISEQTVKHHLTSMFSKVGVSQRLELALFALTHKLIEPGPGVAEQTMVLSSGTRVGPRDSAFLDK